MHGREKSDFAIVAMKPANKAGQPAAEWVERRAETEGNMVEPRTRRTLSRESVPQGLDRVRQVAKARKKERFTALLHHVSVDLLKDAYSWLKRNAAPGVDGVTWQDYAQDLGANIVDLHARIHRGVYRARPSRRKYIAKPDGRQRPLGIAALEDKIVQRALVEVLNAIYEEDFLGFSYGFRAGRSPHQSGPALDPEVAERRGDRGGDVDGVRGGDTAGGIGFTAACERLPALRLRPLGPAVEKTPRARRHDHRALRRRLHRGLSASWRRRAVPH